MQGERRWLIKTAPLEGFNLDGIPPSPRGVIQIEVTFDIDATEFYIISAKDKATENLQQTKIRKPLRRLKVMMISKMKAEQKRMPKGSKA